MHHVHLDWQKPDKVTQATAATAAVLAFGTDAALQPLRNAVNVLPLQMAAFLRGSELRSGYELLTEGKRVLIRETGGRGCLAVAASRGNSALVTCIAPAGRYAPPLPPLLHRYIYR